MIPQNVLPDTAGVNSQGHLVIGGCDTLDLAEEYGTPVYILDEATLRGQCRRFVREFQTRHPNTLIAYASKAYINPALAKIFADEGLGLDVVSGGELAVAQRVDFPLENVYFHGNNKSPQELAEAMESGIGWVVIDSFHELDLLNRLAEEAGKVQNVLIRVSPGVDPHTHVYTTTGILDSKFGFSIQTGHAAQAVRQALAASNLNLRGLHFHLGSPIFELEPYRTAVDLVIRFAAEFREEGLELQEFSPGGGFAIAYTREDAPPEIGDYAEAIVSTMNATCRDLSQKTPRMIIEPGRSIIGPAGVALYRIGAIKDIPGVRQYVSVDGGMGDNIRPALYQASYEVIAAGKADQESAQKVTIAGKYCESGDLLARDVLLPELMPDDIIAIPAAGAYCPSMASNYNLNPRPPMILVNEGHSRLIRRRESYQDLMNCDVL
ncbi:MAG: diaminopimelate decarboxylase [SAR202 cluster bacterium Io17-Chloro-G9]|nr:MAG: diaminopimelate decarboxylase [SAR202 cluster bacterium Io17-Chloro-G9]